MPQYPRDEFDQIPESAARQGVHRERLVPPRSNGLALKVIAGILVLAVGLAAYFLFPRLGLGQASEVTPESSAEPMPSITAEEATGGERADRTAASPAPTDSRSQGTQPTAESRTSPEADPAPAGEPAPDEESVAGGSGTAAVDRSQPVAVLNATTVSGLASTAAGRLQAEGWNVTQIGNWSGQLLQGSVVLYNGEEQRPTAEALAASLGIGATQGNAGFGHLTVVVGPGFQ